MQTLNESREDGIEHDDLSIARALE
ncbi:GntR family transcriptional regulator, partial [Rhizobium ruizarguesonis]